MISLALAFFSASSGAASKGSEASSLKVFDCRLGSEIGSVVPHERVTWLIQGEVEARKRALPPTVPRDRSDPDAADEVVLDFDTALGATMAVNCDSLAAIASVETDGSLLRVRLRGDVRWRIDRTAAALVIWNPRLIYAALSRSWPSPKARQILSEARALGVAPEQADDLESRLDFEGYRRAGLEAVTRGQFAEAAAQLEQAHGFVPNDIEIGIELARARYKLAHYDAAEELLESLLEIAPTSAEVRHEMGLLALSGARTEEAHKHFRAAASASGQKAFFYLGFLAFEAGDDADAERDLARYLVLEGSGPLANRARTMLDLVARRVAAAERPRAATEVTAEAAEVEMLPQASLPSLRDQRLTLRGINVPALDLAALEGRPAIVHLWATWCPPCRVEMPSLRRFVRDRLPSLVSAQSGSPGPAMVTVSMDYTVEELVGTLDAWGEEEPGALPPVYWDPNWQLALGLDLGTALPQTLLVDRHGRVVKAYVGAHDWQDGPLARAIDELIAAP